VEAGEDLPRVEGERRRVRRTVVKALEERAAGGEGKLDDDGKALLRRYAAAVEVPPEQLADLAGKRARRVVELLVKDYTIDSERLSAAAEFVRGRAGVVVELGLPQEPEPEDDPAATM
jgi:chaperonin GroEL (HSP60 family)